MAACLAGMEESQAGLRLHRAALVPECHGFWQFSGTVIFDLELNLILL